ncbi:uncharacterized protein LOC126765684 [Bactrocera neohumeralis]|uniref:uncharacterized protein LOC126765684 n=1 Tax=Bactrocera neohumeralis TaxID=98809 RepID=UPI0021650D76|nr:uncharacterized protein LOC126765684 [Bactrocera neohumeralis]XP_050339364.1 uncharacterized protein LOC126765684 [Bactrocera neohumeralis]
MTLDEMDNTIKTKITSENPFLPILINELTLTQTYLNRLRPKRFKKSIETIGKVWKWIAGNPDHDDLVILDNQINNIINNNNNQVVINKIIFDRINNITRVSNKILKTVQSNEDVQRNFAIELKYKLKIVKEEIINIDYAIHWAKAGIVNSYILSNEELALAKSIFIKNNFTLNNVEESLEFANIKVASNETMLFYMIGIPLINEEICDSIVIKPIKKNKYINKIPYEDIVTCSKHKVFGIKTKCNENNHIRICNYKNMIDISNTTCVPQLLRSEPAECTQINNQHIPSIENIFPGIILLNQYNGTIQIDNQKINLVGSYAVQYRNSTVLIDNQKHSFNEILTSKPLPAILQSNISSNKEEEILSLEMMKELHINNTNHLQTLQTTHTAALITNFSLVVICLISLATIGTAPIIRKNCKTKLIEPSSYNVNVNVANNKEDTSETPTSQVPITLIV